MSEPILTFTDVETYYGDSYVLQQVSLNVAPGSIVAVLGRNGMGKTTLVRTAAALISERR
ncbi:MAG: ATP-binding cassette domain-containing protein, partial [Comamonadaceae bacterium]